MSWEAEIMSLYGRREYEKCIDRLNELAATDANNPRLFLWKGRCLQLVDNPDGPLSEIEDCFIKALSIDDSFTPAVLELGWFYFNVLDDANRALGLFDKAIELEREIAIEALEGKARCLAETRDNKVARDFLLNASNQLINVSTINKLLEQIED